MPVSVTCSYYGTKINRSASSIVMDYYTQYAKEEDISIFDARIYHSVRFSRELELGGRVSSAVLTYLRHLPYAFLLV